MGLDLEDLVTRFAKMCALPREEAAEQEDLCAAGGEEALADYAAALAAKRFVLRCLAAGGVVAIGDPRPGRGGALAAAEAMEQECRRTAARWLRPRGFCFRQTGGKEEAEG